MKILQLSKIDSNALETLRQDHDITTKVDARPQELRALVADQEVVIFRSGIEITREVMEQAPRLRMLVRAGAGLDNIDVEYAQQRGIEVHHIPEPGAQAVAELTIGLMIAVARQVVWADRQLRQGHWAKNEVSGRLLAGQCVGILGAGNIGSRVGELAAALGMRPLGIVKPSTPETDTTLRRKGITPASLKDILNAADFLTVHVPLTNETHHLINKNLLQQMKPGSFLVNMSRGGVVDEVALYQTLVEPARLAGAALDVHANEGEDAHRPLADLDNTVLTPHIGSTADEAQRQIGRRVVDLVNQLH